MSSPRSLHDSASISNVSSPVLGVSRVQPAFHSIAVQQELRGRTFYDRVILRMQRQGRRARDLKAVRQIGRVRFPDLHGRGVVVKAQLRVACRRSPAAFVRLSAECPATKTIGLNACFSPHPASRSSSGSRAANIRNLRVFMRVSPFSLVLPGILQQYSR